MARKKKNKDEPEVEENLEAECADESAPEAPKEPKEDKASGDLECHPKFHKFKKGVK